MSRFSVTPPASTFPIQQRLGRDCTMSLLSMFALSVVGLLCAGDQTDQSFVGLL